nr:NADPH-cytochrome P450 reductase [Polyrhizophydium stewartii]
MRLRRRSAKSSKKSLLALVNEKPAGNGRLIAVYGSQTGTAEDLAARISKEVSLSLSIPTLVVDPEEYDMSELAHWPSGTKDVFGFFLATYGEGEPTDNAVDFYSWLMDGKGTGEDEGDEEDDMVFESPLEGLSFFVFCLGNKTYEYYNAIGRRADLRLERLGAKRIGERGEGDDDASLEEDFLAWKPSIMAALGSFFGVDASAAPSMRDRPHVPAFEVIDAVDPFDGVFHGELAYDKPRSWAPVPGSMADSGDFVVVGSHKFAESKPAGAFDTKHPFYGRIVASRPLFGKIVDDFNFADAQLPASNPPQWTSSGTKVSVKRECFHIELDLSGSGLKYTTGDHVGLWAENSPAEVARLAKVLGIADLDRVIDLVPHDSSSKKPFSTPCTLRAALSNYVDLSEPLKQFHLDVLAKYATDAAEKARLFDLSEDRALFIDLIQNGRKNLADVLEEFHSVKLPLGVVLTELLSRISVRYYSISSSSVEEPTKVSVTAVVVRYAIAQASGRSDGAKKPVVQVKEGITTSWLQRNHDLSVSADFAAKAAQNRSSVPALYVPLYIRSSNFRLPSNPAVPVIMVGPGTGIAPFRAFVRERVLAAQRGETVGTTWLFYGCRNKDLDYLYREELESLEKIVKDDGLSIDLRISTAFSRDGPKKVYVQHLVAQSQDEIWRILEKDRGHFYICGDAKHMAHDVNAALESMAASSGGLKPEAAKLWLKELRGSPRFAEDVWS